MNLCLHFPTPRHMENKDATALLIRANVKDSTKQQSDGSFVAAENLQVEKLRILHECVAVQSSSFGFVMVASGKR